MTDRLERDQDVLTGRPVVELHHDGRRITGVVTGNAEGKSKEPVPCWEVISSMPVSQVVRALRPRAPEAVLEAADGLLYRDMVILFVVLDRPQISPDHWLYVPSQQTGFGRPHVGNKGDVP
jgi:protoporphyrinogen oxidase